MIQLRTEDEGYIINQSPQTPSCLLKDLPKAAERLCGCFELV
jgi:hypothetical protein